MPERLQQIKRKEKKTLKISPLRPAYVVPLLLHIFLLFYQGDFNDYASVVTSRCEDGYRLIGDSVSDCQGDGTWSGEPAYCESTGG